MRPTHRVIELKDVRDDRGKLTFAQVGDHIPFEPRRIFILYDIAAGATRGGHAHRTQHQLLIMVSGSCTVVVDNGNERNEVLLSRPTSVLYVPPMLWLDLQGFQNDAACAVLASGTYDEGDYVRDYGDFLKEAVATA